MTPKTTNRRVFFIDFWLVAKTCSQLNQRNALATQAEWSALLGCWIICARPKRVTATKNGREKKHNSSHETSKLVNSAVRILDIKKICVISTNFLCAFTRFFFMRRNVAAVFLLDGDLIYYNVMIIFFFSFGRRKKPKRKKNQPNGPCGYHRESGAPNDRTTTTRTTTKRKRSKKHERKFVFQININLWVKTFCHFCNLPGRLCGEPWLVVESTGSVHFVRSKWFIFMCVKY